MKISFFNPADLESKLKCTIHKTGKLGFSENTIKKLEINENKGVKIGRSEEEGDEDVLYLKIVEKADSASFKINKAGSYFYVNTKGLFDKLKYDYTNNSITIIFDMEEIEIEEQKIYKLIKREVKKKK